MKTIQRYLTTMAFNAALGGVIKAIVRAKPETHAKYVAFLHEQAVHEMDRFERLHGEHGPMEPEEKVDEPAHR